MTWRRTPDHHKRIRDANLSVAKFAVSSPVFESKLAIEGTFQEPQEAFGIIDN